MDIDVNKLVNDATIEILVNNNTKKVICELYELVYDKNIDSEEIKSTLAFAFYENKNYMEAVKIYNELNMPYHAGFCELLLGNKDKTRELWFNAPESSAICWGKSLIDLIEIKIGLVPTFLQVRNFLERDLTYFIRADKVNYAENVIQCNNFLSDINPEANKFIGKALMNSGFQNLAVTFFLKSQEMIPTDPEIYYYLAQYTYQVGALDETKRMLKQCLDLNITYTPAKILLDKIGNEMISNAKK